TPRPTSHVGVDDGLQGAMPLMAMSLTRSWPIVWRTNNPSNSLRGAKSACAGVDAGPKPVLPACRLPGAGSAALARACQRDRERHVGDRYPHPEWQKPGIVGNLDVDRARRIVRVAIVAGLALEAGNW